MNIPHKFSSRIDINIRNFNFKKEMNNPVSPTSTKSLIESETTNMGSPNVPESVVSTTGLSKSNMLSMTMKTKDNILSKNSGTIEGNSYNSLLSHQSKSFSNTKNDKSANSIINNKTILPKKR